VLGTERRLHPVLPLFALEDGDSALIYTPGHLCRIAAGEVECLVRELERPRGAGSLARLAGTLRSFAQEALRTWDAHVASPFAPESLILYLSTRCSLACRYCFAAEAPRSNEAPVLSEQAVRAAALLVVRSCAEKGRAFTLVLHGGGEPTLHFELIQRVVDITREAAEKAGVAWNAHLATNGVVSEQRARWLAREIGSIGLSCDGPPEMHDGLRPRLSGGSSSDAVERTARAVSAEGGRVQVRATVMPETLERQVEIVEYVGESLGAHVLRVEPAYVVRRRHRPLFAPSDARRFVTHFLAAEAAARRLDMDLRCSAARLDELHGPHCSALRDVLHLLPDGSATACFFSVDGNSPAGGTTTIGRFDPGIGDLILDVEALAAWRRRSGSVPAACRDCLAQLHCARECPEICWGRDGEGPRGGFRCRVARGLTEAWLRTRWARSIGSDPSPLEVADPANAHWSGSDSRLSASPSDRSQG